MVFVKSSPKKYRFICWAFAPFQFYANNRVVTKLLLRSTQDECENVVNILAINHGNYQFCIFSRSLCKFLSKQFYWNLCPLSVIPGKCSQIANVTRSPRPFSAGMEQPARDVLGRIYVFAGEDAFFCCVPRRMCMCLEQDHDGLSVGRSVCGGGGCKRAANKKQSM